MSQLFSSNFFANNRQALRKAVDHETPIFLTAAAIVQRNNDIGYPFRQDSNFWYLTGLTVPQAILVMHGSDEFLVIPELSPVDEVMGAPHNITAIRQQSGIKQIYGWRDGWSHIKKLMQAADQFASLAPAKPYNQHHGFYSNPASREFIRKLKRMKGGAKLIDLREPLMRQRMIKQDPELKAIKQAVTITGRSIEAVSQRLSQYRYEYEIEADLSHDFRAQGARGHAFTPIVASGARTCHLHYEANADRLAGKQHLYIDVGAEYEHYAADITRSYFLRQPSARLQAIYRATKAVQDFALNNLKPGITIRENEKAVVKFMGQQLSQLGLIKSERTEEVRQYYTHACSHYLGLDTHDIGDYDAPLQPGMVLTVEPGIYVKEEGLGVRIEDDVVVTANGIENLSQSVPYEVQLT